MAKNQKYVFDSKSLSFEKAKRRPWVNIWRAVGFVSIAGVAGLFMATYITQYLASPKELQLQNDNRILISQLVEMERQVDEMEEKIGELNNMDVKIYRSIYEANPPKKPDYRGADFKELQSLPRSKQIIRIRQKLQKLDDLAIAQANSYKSLKKLITSKKVMMNSIPSIQPVKNKDLKRMASGYGYRIDPFYHTRRFHSGMDFTAPTGTEVYATGDGVIIHSSNDGWGYGINVRINHGFGYTTLYGHLSRVAVRKGKRVKRGEVIGYVGSTGKSTGPHLHYEVRKNNNPLNPGFFYHNDLTDKQYTEMLEYSKRETKSFD
ncbi:MAG: M23 family metallopeptidase [Bacteroidia bacterium]|jgi:murein DD-endopeptidase MepM/ murein hydrolase activator NlpD|nr:M23 family metallopeptidase [Bacteroidia bacterium]